MNLADQRIVITGGTGFLGRYLHQALIAQNCQRILAVGHEHYNLAEAEDAYALVHEQHPDVIFHLAAKVGGIGANRATPATFIHDNALMGLHLLDAARDAGVSKLVMVGTTCAYPKFAVPPFKESALWDGYPEETNAPYGIAKRMLLVAADAYRQQYGLNVITLIPTNLYGAGDNFDLQTSHVIPALIRKIDAALLGGDAAVKLWGDGSPTRDFLYVSDCVQGLLAAARDYNAAEPINLGSGEEISIAAVAQTLATIMGFTGTFVWDPAQPNGQPRRQLDVTRARDRLHWTATTPLEHGLQQTVDWWRNEGREIWGLP
jgi:GDP-L-fucose synthase